MSSWPRQPTTQSHPQRPALRHRAAARAADGAGGSLGEQDFRGCDPAKVGPGGRDGGDERRSRVAAAAARGDQLHPAILRAAVIPFPPPLPRNRGRRRRGTACSWRRTSRARCASVSSPGLASTNFCYLSTYEDTRDLFAILHDICIYEAVFWARAAVGDGGEEEDDDVSLALQAAVQPAQQVLYGVQLRGVGR
ncbi:hypothetical protein DL769_006985 [Monosporascus sp. CRB-8-3]|nr:hypothetical protein DL769_006985 [Monosporascus sp. CRB-8-3]